jgi:hypothetical protein
VCSSELGTDNFLTNVMKDLEEPNSTPNMVELNLLRKKLQAGLKYFCSNTRVKPIRFDCYKYKGYGYTEESLFRVNDDLLTDLT